MKRNMIIIAVLTAMTMLSGCGGTNTNTLDKDITETQAEPTSAVSSVTSKKNSPSKSLETADSSVSSEKNNSSVASGTASSETESKKSEVEPSKQGFFAVENPPATSISVASLDGVWYCTTTDSKLWLTGSDDLYSGTWHDEMEEGDIKLEYSVNDSGEKSYWYNLYNSRGQLWYTIYAAGEIPFDELVVKNDIGDDFRYVRETENADNNGMISNSEYNAVENPPAASISVASLDGVWHCTTTDSTLWFTRSDDLYSGTWHDEMEEGDVKLEYSVNDSGEKSYWYNLYNNRGQLWYTIYAAGEIPFDELVVKNDSGDDFYYTREE